MALTMSRPRRRLLNQLNPAIRPGSEGFMQPNRTVIDARAPLSAVDAAARERGTYASPPSADWRKIFPSSTMDRVADSVDNPPPMNNDRGQANVTGPTSRTVQMRDVPSPVTGASGNVTSDAANLAQNRAMYSPGGMTVGAVETKSGAPVITHRGPVKLDVNSDAVQSMLDRAAGYTGHVATEQHTSVPTAYGTGNVRFDTGGKGLEVAQAQPIMENGKQIGVGRPTFDINTARKNTESAYPDVLKVGTPEHTAFLDYAKKNGEQAAHENVHGIMQPIVNDRIAKAGGATPSAAQVRSELPAPGSTADVLSQQGIAKAQGTGYKQGSIMDKVAGVVGSVKSAPAVGDVIQSGAEKALGGLGFNAQDASRIAQGGRQVLKSSMEASTPIDATQANPFQSAPAKQASPAAQPPTSAAVTKPATPPQPQPAVSAPPVATMQPRTFDDL